MRSHKTVLAEPVGIQSSDSSLGMASDSLASETRPLDAPEAVNRNESSDSYGNVVALLNRKWRVIRCRDGIQWILQSQDSLTAAVGIWRGRSYCRTKEALLRVCAARASKIDPTAAAVLAALPDWIEARNRVVYPDGTLSADCNNLARTQQHCRDLARAIYPRQSAATSALSESDVAGAPGKAVHSFGLGRPSERDPSNRSHRIGPPVRPATRGTA